MSMPTRVQGRDGALLGATKYTRGGKREQRKRRMRCESGRLHMKRKGKMEKKAAGLEYECKIPKRRKERWGAF